MSNSDSLLPRKISQLFEPRPLLKYVQPIDVAPQKRSNQIISGMSSLIHDNVLKDYIENAKYEPTEGLQQKQIREKKEKKRLLNEKLKKDLDNWHPNHDSQIIGNPFKTLFLSRLPYDISEDDLHKIFDQYGEIKRIRIIEDKYNKNKKKGYAFILFERESDFIQALNSCKNLKIKNRLIIGDIERGRRMNNWLPRRLGGGLGGRGYTKRDFLSSSFPSNPTNLSHSSPSRNRYHGKPPSSTMRNNYSSYNNPINSSYKREYNSGSNFDYRQRDSMRDSTRDPMRDRERERYREKKIQHDKVYNQMNPRSYY
ncbi:U1 snRNP complex subunit SNP1 [Ascoidea rubescens DSM 1968]|uniref:RNA-binding domain-containing protein n=1 Tax=Ascoidea rubescens DSM 1968 TaxID=1344418 RepID=A0A1D2VKH6_9ASCO|nr:RNA-binding domain-containing protein [Ascoidea rubescens DSM 1968]ODV62106.1 RNA-binding domain-containing protein [Ascoidea rubescens DSM 1968]